MRNEDVIPTFTVALVGTPNSGKSTLFNTLTGLHQKIANYPGVTIEPSIGSFYYNSIRFNLIDLPGTYSLAAKSIDEEYTTKFIKGELSPQQPKPDCIVLVIDGTKLEKGLFLYTYLQEYNVPIIIAITMIDSIKAAGSVFDDVTLERLLSTPVVGVVGSKGLGIDTLKEQLVSNVGSTESTNPKLSNVENIEERVAWSNNVMQQVIANNHPNVTSERIDKIVLHPKLGLILFTFILAIFFQSIFSWAEPVMNLIEELVALLQGSIDSIVQNGVLHDFISNGIISGVGSVVIFLPQIIILTLLVSILEDSGYLARAAFLVDRIMGIFGLQGRSFIPLLGSFACAIPGIMSARIIPSYKDRLITILIAPLMTCSARLPVYTLLIAAFIPDISFYGFISLQVVVLAMLYTIGLLSGLIIALVLKKTKFRSDITPFLLEFPPYRFPTLKNISISIWIRTKDFLTTAGTIILSMSVMLWVLTEFPKTEAPIGTNPETAQMVQLENSFAGMIGKTIQPVFAPIGFDWKITISVLGSFAARETFISFMGQIYSTKDDTEHQPLRQVLKTSISLPTALSILIFYVFALQCMSTIAIIKRETQSWKWSAFAFAYTFVLAYVGSFCTYHLAIWFCS
ncbi:MAG: ferrous iron transport protein B [Candidatus Kapaibacterium sp.]|nr:ferrous iron transport protein B [Bacteroidota bacterium]